MAVVAAVESELSIRATGVKTTVPEDNIARLMYYLNCMHNCIPGDVVPSMFTNYSRYYSLSDDEKTAVVGLSVLLSPDLLLGKVIFPVDNSSQLLNGMTNEFYDLREAKRLLAGAATAEGVLILEGKTVDVTKIMVFTENWLMKFFINPLKSEAWRIRQLSHEGSSSPRPISYSSSSYPSSNTSRRNTGKCGSYCAAFFGLLAVIGVVVGIGTSAWLTYNCDSGWVSTYLWQECCHSCFVSSADVCSLAFGGDNKCIEIDSNNFPTSNYILGTKIAGIITAVLVLAAYYNQIRYTFYGGTTKTRCILSLFLVAAAGIATLVLFALDDSVRNLRSTNAWKFGYSADLFALGLAVEILPLLYLCCRGV